MAILGWENIVEIPTTILSASSAVSTMPVEMLRLPQGSPSVAWQTQTGVTSASLTITATAAVLWRVAVLSRTNLTTSATIRVRLSNSLATITSSPLYDSGVVSAGIVRGVGQALHVLPSAVSATIMRIDLADAANQDSYLNIPLAYAGAAYEAPIALSSDFGLDVRRSDVQTRGGTIFTEALSRARGWQFSTEFISETELTWIRDLEIASANGTNVLFVPRFPFSGASAEAVYGLLSPGRRGFVTHDGSTYRWTANISERL